MNETSLKQSDFVAAQPNPWRPWVAASIAAVAILGIAIGLMALLGLFRPPQNDTGAKSLAAALGLVGAVMSAVVALVGTIIKYSIDDRNARQADIEASRNYALALQAEHRNRIEAAIRAVDLLSENNEDATESQMGGALLALVSLGEVQLALSLLAQLWPKRQVSSSIADVILSNALMSNSEETQIAAGIALYENASRIEERGTYIWPISNLGWRKDLPNNCRLALALAAAEWLVSVAGDRPASLRSPALVLYQALEDEEPNIADLCAGCLRPLVKKLPRDMWRSLASGSRVTVADITERLTRHDAPTQTDYGERYEKQITALYASLVP